MQTLSRDLQCATTTVLHGVADVSRFSTSSDERRYVVVIQVLQLHTSIPIGLQDYVTVKW